MGSARLLGALSPVLLLGLWSLLPSGAEEPRRPNILLILADDLGYGDLSIQGSQRVQTPNIDRLAREGVRFTNSYANSSICAPTRAALMTGRYQQRSGYSGFTGPMRLQVETDRGLDVEQRLMPELLQGAGYVTGAIGKWHLGINEPYRPNRRGFDEFFGFLHGAHDYIQWDSERFGPIYRNAEPVQGSGYLTDAFSDEALAFLERHQEVPFFLYLSYNAVHSPLQVRNTYRERVLAQAPDDPFPRDKESARVSCLAMGLALDVGIGRVLDKLDELGLSERTLVVFANDNGGVEGVSDNRPFRGGKVSMFEGGLRVPFFMRYPGTLKAGSSFAPVVSTMDLMPTFLALAGAELPEDLALDGKDLMPFLEGRAKGVPHALHFWALGQTSVLRQGNLKLIHGKRGNVSLFDLAADPSESKNLAGEFPEKVKSMQLHLASWLSEMPAPDWTKSDDEAWYAEQTGKRLLDEE